MHVVVCTCTVLFDSFLFPSNMFSLRLIYYFCSYEYNAALLNLRLQCLANCLLCIRRNVVALSVQKNLNTTLICIVGSFVILSATGQIKVAKSLWGKIQPRPHKDP